MSATRQGSSERRFCSVRTSLRFQCLHTCSLFTGECQVIVAGHVVPLSSFMPDHHHAILSRLEETVWLVWPPVVKLLLKNMFSFHAWVLGCWSQVIKIRLQLQQHSCLDKWESFWWEKDFFSKLMLQFPWPTEDGANMTPRGKQTHKQDALVCFKTRQQEAD